MKLKDRKAFKLLSMLKFDEFDEFGKWLKSPWCNSIKKLVDLYQLLKPFYPAYDDKRLSVQWVHRHLYPEQNFTNDKQLRNLLTKLAESILLFLSIKQLKQDKNLQQQLHVKAYLNHGESSRFVKASNQLIQELKAKPVKEWEDYLNLLLLNEQLYYQAQTNYRQNNIENPLGVADTMLDQFYALGKLRFANELLERQKQLKVEAAHDDLSLAVEFPEEEASLEVKLYQKRLSQITSTPLQAYKELYDEYFKIYDQINAKDKKILYIYLINEASRLFRAGEDILSSIFDLYQIGFEQRILIHEGKITGMSFVNMVTVGNSLKKYKAVHQFVDQYTSYLPDVLQEDASKFAIAHSAFHQEDYLLCIATLLHYKHHTPIFRNRSRILLLQAYFERFLQDYTTDEALFRYAKAFENQVRIDKRLKADTIKAFMKFISYTEKLVRWIDEPRHDHVQLEKIRKALNKEKNVHAIGWLKKKYELAKKGYPI